MPSRAPELPSAGAASRNRHYLFTALSPGLSTLLRNSYVIERTY